MPTLATRPTQTISKRRRLSTKTKVIAAILCSLLVHAILLLVLGWVVPHWPHAKVPTGRRPIRLTFAPAKPAPTAAPQPSGPNSKPDYIRTLDEQKAEHAPDDPNFISDKDTLAASELAATGNKPLPTLEGRDIPTLDFDTRPWRDGKQAQDAASAAPAAPPAPQTPKQEPDTKKPAPHSKKLFTAKPPSTPKPAGDLAAAPDASPTPEPPTPNETPDEASAPPVPRESQRAALNPSVNSPGQVHPPGYQPQTIKSKVSGGISNRGIAAPSAIGTPLGRYQKAMEDSIGMLWYQLIDQRMDVLAPGNVKIQFSISRSGRPINVRVISGRTNSVLADVSIQAITEAPIPPIPPDVAATLPGGQLDYDGFDFSFFTN